MVDAAGIETDCRPLHFAAQLAPVLGTDCDFKNESSLSISFIFFSRHDFESKGCHQELPTVHLYMFIPGFPVCIEEDHHCLPLLDALFQKLWILRAFKIFLRTFWRHEPTPKPKCVCGQEILSCFHSFMDFRRLHCIPPITQLLCFQMAWQFHAWLLVWMQGGGFTPLALAARAGHMTCLGLSLWSTWLRGSWRIYDSERLERLNPKWVWARSWLATSLV